MTIRDRSAGGPTDRTRFEATVMAHLEAALNLARWLTRDERDAEDLLQEACLRAFRFLDTFHGGNGRAWFLSIVRNTYYSGLKKNRSQALNVPLEEDGIQESDSASPFWVGAEDPSCGLEREEAKRRVRKALDELPEEYREVIVLRELEELSYQEIARIAQIPLGTVMSRLSRARKLLYRALQQVPQET